MKDKYLIGEVCKLFNVTRDTLVHYDKIGLLSPKKDKNNGYRYYKIEDLNCLTDIIFYKSLNLSLNDIDRVIKDCSPEQILNLVKEKEIYIKKEMDKIKKIQKRLESMKVSLEECIYDSNKVELIKDEKESYFFLEITKENNFNDFIELVEKIQNIDQYIFDYINFSFLIDDGVLFDDEAEDKIKWGITITENIEKIKNNIESKSIEFISEEKYMYTVISLADNDYDDWIKYVRNIVKQNNIQVSGPILGQMLITVYKDESPIDYFGLYIPVK
ncbi:MerR family transcriptional regulator [Terrisporobacter mayombei]|nr:MerR family transcriptional regulator [Terrisporobacter mayombei]